MPEAETLPSRRKLVVWIKSSALWDHHSTRHLSTIQPDPLDHPQEGESQAVARDRLTAYWADRESRTTAGQKEVDFVFITLMLGAQMQLKLMDRVYLKYKSAFSILTTMSKALDSIYGFCCRMRNTLGSDAVHYPFQAFLLKCAGS